MFEFIKTYKYRRQLKKTREECQLLFDYASKKRTNQGWDQWRDFKDFFTARELRVWDEISAEEWALSKILGEKSEWGNVKSMRTLLGEDSPVGFMSVTENRHSKVTWVYDEDLDGYVKVRDGQRDTARRWVMKDGEPVEPREWEDFTPFTPRAVFERDWKRKPDSFYEAMDAFHEAKTPEDKQAVIDKYKEENPNWN